MSLPVTPRTDIAVRKTAYAIVFIALGVALSPFTSVPIGIAKINPTQHFLNVALATLLGPAWAF
ncbi:MAG TPA: energy coupling factor transporter S component ThiW, partial [Treponemataceae bacterium]|nr:energy coupling factor transporter S component ThiW [Treponemataceae bacterium]